MSLILFFYIFIFWTSLLSSPFVSIYLLSFLHRPISLLSGVKKPLFCLRDENFKKKRTIFLISRKQQFLSCITLFCTFICRLFTKEATTKFYFYFSSWTWIWSLRIQLPEDSPTKKMDRNIMAITTKRTQIHFLKRRSRRCYVAGSRMTASCIFLVTGNSGCLYSNEDHNMVACRNRRFMDNRFDNWFLTSWKNTVFIPRYI